MLLIHSARLSGYANLTGRVIIRAARRYPVADVLYTFGGHGRVVGGHSGEACFVSAVAFDVEGGFSAQGSDQV